MKKIIVDSIIILVSVTLAFLAENLREYLNERGYEQEIIKDIRADIVGDTVQLFGFVNYVRKELPRMDSTIIAIDKTPFQAGDTIDLSYLKPRFVLFPRTGGYNDLKSNYGTNLIQSNKLRKAITRYYEYRDYTLVNWTKLHQDTQSYIDLYLRESYDLLDDSYATLRHTSKKSDLKNIYHVRKADLGGQLFEFETQLARGRKVIEEIDIE